MNTNLNVRKPIVLTLAALAFVLVASVLLVSLLHAASGANEMGARVSPNPRVSSPLWMVIVAQRPWMVKDPQQPWMASNPWLPWMVKDPQQPWMDASLRRLSSSASPRPPLEAANHLRVPSLTCK